MYIRKVKKGNKTYFYYYKSKRIGNKVKSIYVGKALEKDIEKPIKIKYDSKKEAKKDNLSVVNSLLEFDNLLNEINKLIMNKDLNNAIFTYNMMFEVYKKMDINHVDKVKVFEKLN
ncbi:MAG: hypothetical protein AABW57_01250, partial [Nanoarchaeota archaeon]